MKLFILFMIIFLSTNLFAWNRAEIRDLGRLKIQDTSSNTSRQKWTDAQLNMIIDITILDIVKKTRCLPSTTYYATYISTKWYTLPSDTLEVDRVAIYITTGAYRTLKRVTFGGMDAESDGNWESSYNANSTPLKYLQYGDSIKLLPPCNASYAKSDGLEINYIVKPSTLTTDTDIPFMGRSRLYPYHELIATGMAYRCKYIEKDFNTATNFYNDYMNSLRIMTGELNRTSDFFPDLQPQPK